MTSEDLKGDLNAGSFAEMVGALPSDSADVEAHNAATDVAFQTDGSEVEPGTPMDDLFRNASPLEFVGQELQVDSESNVQGSRSPLRSRADVPISKADYNRALFEARLSAVGESELKLPWEQGVWKAIFADDDSDVFPSVLPPVPGEYLVQASATSSASGDVSEAAEKSMARKMAAAEPSEEAVERASPMDAAVGQRNAERSDDEASSEIPSTGSSSSDSSSASEAEGANPLGLHIEGPVWRNRKSHVVHKCAELSFQTTCGRKVDEAHFELLEEGCSTLNARCSRCFKGEVVSSVDGLVKALDQSKSKRLKRQ
ncbi:unnamed protein product [Cladocopium goreaui]|uniref:Uncharacterized protein n=1 Tax=Cladocopium goreaui TaxID=2562237 RepID=A0A9P1CKL2_9DINO|nr:unnamed protein product [Cladocopium goreaui]